MNTIKLLTIGLMSFFYITTGIKHFTEPEWFLQIYPPFLPFGLAAVYISGFFEVLFGVLLLIPKTRYHAAWGLIALLIAVFPANIYLAYTNGAAMDISPESGLSIDLVDLFGGGDDNELDSGANVKAKVKGVEFWMSYTLMDNGNFSLWAGPLYAHLYQSTGSFAGISESESITDSDYGLMFGGSVPLRGNISINAGYYRSLDDHEIEGMNNFFLELNYKL